MKKYYSYAKINLGLKVGKVLENNYHEINSIIAPIKFCDIIYFKKSKKFKIKSNYKIENNILEKVFTFFKQNYSIDNFKIILRKNIPLGSGLGGGSSNCSLLINYINKKFNLNLSKKELENIALKFGTDTLYFLYNKLSYLSGYGNQIEFLNKKINKNKVLLILSKKIINTKSMYNKLNKQNINNDLKINLNYLDKYNHLYENDFLNLLLNEDLEFKNLYDNLKNNGYNFSLSGSGDTLYFLNYHNKDYKIIKKIIKKYENYYLIKTNLI